MLAKDLSENMIAINIAKEGKGRHRRFYFEIWTNHASLIIRKTPKGAKVSAELFIDDKINPHELSSLLRVSSIVSTLIGLHLDFVQIHHALQSIEGIQVNDIRFLEHNA